MKKSRFFSPHGRQVACQSEEKAYLRWQRLNRVGGAFEKHLGAKNNGVVFFESWIPPQIFWRDGWWKSEKKQKISKELSSTNPTIPFLLLKWFLYIPLLLRIDQHEKTLHACFAYIALFLGGSMGPGLSHHPSRKNSRPSCCEMGFAITTHLQKRLSISHGAWLRHL